MTFTLAAGVIKLKSDKDQLLGLRLVGDLIHALVGDNHWLMELHCGGCRVKVDGDGALTTDRDQIH